MLLAHNVQKRNMSKEKYLIPPQICTENENQKHRATVWVSSELYQYSYSMLQESCGVHEAQMLHDELFLAVVVVFITHAGRRPGAAAGPASLTLQSGLAQESVVV